MTKQKTFKCAKDFFDRGLEYFWKNGFDKAIDDFSNAIRLASNDACVYYMRGRAHSSKGSLDKAIADYKAALRIDPNYAEAKKWLETATTLKPEAANKKPHRKSSKLRSKPAGVDLENLRLEAFEELKNMEGDYHYISEGKVRKYLRELEQENEKLKRKSGGKKNR